MGVVMEDGGGCEAAPGVEGTLRFKSDGGPWAMIGGA